LLAPPPDAQRTASGLLHRELAKPRGSKRAQPHDRVRIAYVGWDAEGRVIDSSAPRGAYAEVLAGHGFPGFREAIALLHEGERRRFWIPEALAWQSHAMAVRGPLVFDLELVAVLDMPDPPPTPPDVAAPPASAIRTPSGLAYRVLQRGVGTRKPGADSAVEVHYSYWSSDGRLIDSTVPNVTPHRTAFKDRDLAPGVVEALREMVVGERRRLWVPESLGFPGQQKPAPGVLRAPREGGPERLCRTRGGSRDPPVTRDRTPCLGS
jgi:peptidylprolyl isomerase